MNASVVTNLLLGTGAYLAEGSWHNNNRHARRRGPGETTMVWTTSFKRSLARSAGVDAALATSTVILAVTDTASPTVIGLLLLATALAVFGTTLIVAAHWVAHRIISDIDLHLEAAAQRGEAQAYAEILSPGSTTRRGHLRSIW
jgi:hypothetical protein